MLQIENFGVNLRGSDGGQSILMTLSLGELDLKLVDGLLRVCGRLTNSHLGFKAKHLTILPARQCVVHLLVQNAHAAEGPSGENHVLAKTFLDLERKSNSKASNQRVYVMSEAHVRNGKATHGPDSEMQRESWLVAVQRHWGQLFTFPMGSMQETQIRTLNDVHKILSRTSQRRKPDKQEIVPVGVATFPQQRMLHY